MLAEDPQTLSFDLLMNGEVVGSREVSIRYLPPEEDIRDREVRIAQTWTEIDATIAGWDLSVRNRTTSHASGPRSSFTSSLSVNGDLSEVQGSLIEDGRWSLSAVSGGRLHTQELRRTEVDLSTMDLLDPVRARLIEGQTDVRLLSAETGEVLVGTEFE